MEEVQRVVYDDLIWKDREEKVEASEAFEFSVGDATYHLDLTTENLQQIEAMFAPLMEAASEVPSKRRKTSSGGGGKTGGSKTGGSRKPTAEEKRENDAIREWARTPVENGGGGFLDLSDKGRIPQDVRDAYYAAKSGQEPGQVAEDTLTEQAPPQPGGQPQFV